jgi:hypothetical protein
MIWPLLKLDLRKALPTYLVLLVAHIGFILITRDILDSSNVFVVVLALAQGWMLAWRIFRDAPDTPSFLFSRPWSRPRMFWQRWTLAMTLQIITVLLIYIILASGTRTLLFQRQVPYFPMVERFELSILWPISLTSVITFHIIMFLILWGRLGYNPGSARPWHGIVVKIAIALILMTFIGGGTVMHVAMSEGPILRTGDLALIYAVVLTIMCTAASLNCYKHMEIES